ncbi:MAG: hypothetical protein CMJ64_23875 [Planctomycetaceae bacterium]|jgi:hypothetical protein|nr:hypothetical protein [Planctomycetaceae bacterium]
MQRLTNVGIFSFAKVMGITGFLLGLIGGLFYGSGLMLFGATVGAAAEDGVGLALVGVGGGLFVMVVLPFLVALAYFVLGLLHAVIINIVLYLAGGLELRIIDTANRIQIAK